MQTRSTPHPNALLSLAGLWVLGGAWLIPNKEALWISLWNEAATVLGLLLLALAPLFLGKRRTTHWGIAWPMAALTMAGVFMVWAQWTGGQLHYVGDAWLVTLYLGLFALSVLAGRVLASDVDGGHWSTALSLTILAAGLISAWLVLMQWLWAQPLPMWGQELANTSRPYANLGQPNHANTLLFLALCCVLQLRREKAIGSTGALTAIGMLTFAMAITQSRTGVLQLALLFGWSVWLSLADRERSEWHWGAVATALGAALWFTMPRLQVALLLPSTIRKLGLEYADSDARLQAWRTFFDAALQMPWTGYGWLQSGAAQASMAACHPGLRSYFSYTHMLALDWVVWLGFPMAGAMLALLGWWLWRHLPSRCSTAAGYWLLALLGLLVHAMLEYPQAYTYFLLPAGLIAGVIDARNPRHQEISVAPRIYAAGWCALATLAMLTAWDVGRASTTFTDIRFENARIGLQRNPVVMPELVVLNQLQAYLEFGAANPFQRTTPDSLAAYDVLVQRFPQQALLLRYSAMLDASGKPDDATSQQQLLCDIYGTRHCAEAVRQWRAWQQEHPTLHLGDFKGEILAPRCPQ